MMIIGSSTTWERCCCFAKKYHMFFSPGPNSARLELLNTDTSFNSTAKTFSSTRYSVVEHSHEDRRLQSDVEIPGDVGM